MQVNFDLLIAGCNTRCRHCYVKGGPGKIMDFGLALDCIRQLDALGARLPFPASFTLDNEPINHPDITAIVRAASAARHIEHFHHGMTTGIALMAREDKAEIVRTYLDCGCVDFGVTLHGSEAHHDELVRRNGAFQTTIRAAEFLKAQGAELSVSLMLNRFFPEDAPELDRVLTKLRPKFVYFAVPNYTPHANMAGFEPWRASLSDLRALSPRLAEWGQDVDVLLREAELHTPAAAAELLERELSLRELFSAEQDELYCSVHQDGLLYLGNTGVETACLGDLRVLDSASAAETIARAKGNRDYGAFYDPELLPDQGSLILALKSLPRDLLYADTASVVYRGLEALGTRTILLNAP